MFLLVSVRHVGAHPDELQHGVSIQSSINLGKTFPRILVYELFLRPKSWGGSLYIYLRPFISQILDFICRMVLNFILFYFEWRDTENQQYTECKYGGLSVCYRKISVDRAGRRGSQCFWKTEYTVVISKFVI